MYNEVHSIKYSMVHININYVCMYKIIICLHTFFQLCELVFYLGFLENYFLSRVSIAYLTPICSIQIFIGTQLLFFLKKSNHIQYVVL